MSGLHPSAANLDGHWIRVRAEGEPPGQSLGVDFTVNGKAISGTGDWQGEAMPGGSLLAAGQIVRDDLRLTLTFVRQQNGVEVGRFTEQFTGRLTSRTDIEGTTTAGDVTGFLHLRRSP